MALAFANYGGNSILFGMVDDGRAVGLADPAASCLGIENRVNDVILDCLPFLGQENGGSRGGGSLRRRPPLHVLPREGKPLDLIEDDSLSRSGSFVP